MMSNRVIAVLLCAAGFIWMSMSPAVNAAGNSALKVYAVNYPLQYMAERIGGDHVEVFFPAPADVDPAFWRPDEDTILRYQQADIILINGAGYSQWLTYVVLPYAGLVDTTANISDSLIMSRDARSHAHGDGPVRTDGDAAYITWLDPELAVEQARAVKDAFIMRKPEHEPFFSERFELLEEELDALDNEWISLLDSYRGALVPVADDIYEYWAARYGLNLHGTAWSPDRMPPDEEWRKLDEIIKEHPVDFMIWNSVPDSDVKDRLRKRGIESVVIQSADLKPEEGGFMDVMRANVERFRLVAD